MLHRIHKHGRCRCPGGEATVRKYVGARDGGEQPRPQVGGYCGSDGSDNVGGREGGLDNRGCEEIHHPEAQNHQDVDEREQSSVGGSKRVAEGGFVMGGMLRVLASHDVREGLAFFGLKPAGVFGAIGEVEEGDKAHEDGGDAFGEEEPLPVAQAKGGGVGEVEDATSQGVADDTSDGGGGKEKGGGAGQVFLGNPVHLRGQRPQGPGAACSQMPWAEIPAHHLRPGIHRARAPIRAA